MRFLDDNFITPARHQNPKGTFFGAFLSFIIPASQMGLLYKKKKPARLRTKSELNLWVNYSTINVRNLNLRFIWPFPLVICVNHELRFDLFISWNRTKNPGKLWPFLWRIICRKNWECRDHIKNYLILGLLLEDESFITHIIAIASRFFQETSLRALWHTISASRPFTFKSCL